jgi:hypothetical protein
MMQGYTSYVYLETALHVSSGTSTHHQERLQLYLQHLVFVTPLLLPTAVVEEMETGLSVLWVAYAYSNMAGNFVTALWFVLYANIMLDNAHYLS